MPHKHPSRQRKRSAFREFMFIIKLCGVTAGFCAATAFIFCFFVVDEAHNEYFERDALAQRNSSAKTPSRITPFAQHIQKTKNDEKLKDSRQFFTATAQSVEQFPETSYRYLKKNQQSSIRFDSVTSTRESSSSFASDEPVKFEF